MMIRSLQTSVGSPLDHKYLTSSYSAFNTVRYSISSSTVQNLDIPIRDSNITHLYLSFVRNCDLNYKVENKMFVNTNYLIPKHLKRMRLFNNLSSPATLYENFELDNLQLKLFDKSMHTYCEYLVDNFLIHPKNKYNFFCNSLTEEKHTSNDLGSYQRPELSWICPVNLIPIQKQMSKHGNHEYNINVGAISSSALSLCLEFTSNPGNNYYLLVTYQSMHSAQFSHKNSTDQSVKFSPKSLYK